MGLFRPVAGALPVVALAACASAPRGTSGTAVGAGLEAFADTVQANTFRWFRETTNSRNGLAPDRTPDPPFASIASVGFAPTAWPVGVERGWITREQAKARTLATLRFLKNPHIVRGLCRAGFTGGWLEGRCG